MGTLNTLKAEGKCFPRWFESRFELCCRNETFTAFVTKNRYDSSKSSGLHLNLIHLKRKKSLHLKSRLWRICELSSIQAFQAWDRHGILNDPASRLRLPLFHSLLSLNVVKFQVTPLPFIYFFVPSRIFPYIQYSWVSRKMRLKWLITRAQGCQVLRKPLGHFSFQIRPVLATGGLLEMAFSPKLKSRHQHFYFFFRFEKTFSIVWRFSKKRYFFKFSVSWRTKIKKSSW